MQVHPALHALPRSIARALAFVAGLLMAIGALAQEAPTGLDAGLASQVRDLALEGTHASAPGMPRIDISLGQLDPRLRLAPCNRVEPYLPPGTKLWGKARIGLRCLEGQTRWNVYLPITVKVYGRALVATNGAAAGSVLTMADVTQDEVDLAEDNSAPLVDANAVVGRVLAQSLRAVHLKVRQWFAAGDTVKVIASGPGFNVAGEGQALTNGMEGQSARVRTESGRVLTGLPVADRQLEVNL